MRRKLMLCAIAALVLAGCSVSPGEKVTIGIDDQRITVSPASVLSGRVRLAIDSVGEQTHDLALMLGKDVAALPRTPDGKLDLVANRPIDEIKEFKPGHYIATSPNLPEGEYLVVCTLHQDQVKFASLTIKPRKKSAT